MDRVEREGVNEEGEEKEKKKEKGIQGNKSDRMREGRQEPSHPLAHKVGDAIGQYKNPRY